MATAGIWPVCCHPFFAGFSRVCRPVPCQTDSRSVVSASSHAPSLHGRLQKSQGIKKGAPQRPCMKEEQHIIFYYTQQETLVDELLLPCKIPVPPLQI